MFTHTFPDPSFVPHLEQYSILGLGSVVGSGAGLGFGAFGSDDIIVDGRDYHI